MLHHSCIVDSRTTTKNPMCCLIEPLPHAATWERQVEGRQGGEVGKFCIQNTRIGKPTLVNKTLR